MGLPGMVATGARRRAPVLTAALAVLAFSLGAAASAAAAGGGPVNLKLRDARGHSQQLKSVRGHIVVLNFWATWCGPCRREMPLLVAAAKQYEPQGIVFIGASLDDRKTMAQVPGFVAAEGVTYPVWTGAGLSDLARLKLGDAIPDTVILNSQGEVVFRIVGEMRPGELRARLDWLLGDRAGPAPPPRVTHL